MCINAELIKNTKLKLINNNIQQNIKINIILNMRKVNIWQV
jgi:hypothetical protein